MKPLKSNYQTQAAPFFRSLTDDQLQVLHMASLEIIERTGMRFYDQEAIELFKKAGARISDGNRVCIPPHLVEWALKVAPKRVVLCDREGRRVMPVEDHRVYYGVGSDCMYIYDPYTGQRRRAVLQDVVNGMHLVDYLPNMDFVMSMFLPSDVPVELTDRYQMEIMLLESKKPIIFITNELSGAIDAIEMAEVVAGGLEALQRNPCIVCYANATSPLRHNKEAVQKLLYCAQLNLPVIYIPVARRGITSPITAAGSLALGNAGQLAGIVLAQLKREGAPVIRNSCGGGTLDMRTLTGPYAAPDSGPFGWELAHHYGLPIFGMAGYSDSKVMDEQAAAEAALSIFANAISGANLVHDVGYLDFGMTGSLEMVVFCDEVISWTKRYLRGLEINEETLALDLIDETGPDGHFLETEHTLRHFREDWLPTLLDRRDYDDWVAAGATTLQQRANQKVREILETHRPKPLPDEIVRRVKTITQRAGTQTKKRH